MMKLRNKCKRMTALLLSILMVLSCMPVLAIADAIEELQEGVFVDVILDEGPFESTAPELEEADTPDEPEELSEDEEDSEDEDELLSEDDPARMEDSETEPDDLEKNDPEAEVPETNVPAEETTEKPEIEVPEETTPAATETSAPAEEPTKDPETVEPTEVPTEVPTVEPTAEPTEPETTPVVDNRHPLQAAIEDHGHVYVATARKTEVFASSSLRKDSLVYTTTSDVFLVLATAFTADHTVQVWFLDESNAVISGYVSVNDLDDHYVLDKDIPNSNYLPAGQGMTAIGLMPLFLVNGSAPVVETAMPEEPSPEPVEEPVPEVVPEPDADPTVDPETPVPELPVEEVEPEEVMDEDEQPEEEVTDQAEPGDYKRVTTKTRVFGAVDPDAAETTYSGCYLGHFVQDATVQILAVDADDAGEVWYQVRFLYGDTFADGRMKWTDYSTAWILASETGATKDDSCTVTDFAYTMEYLQMTRSSGMRLLMKATPMNGFKLKDINVPIGGFYAWQEGLYGSSGLDSEYPQLAQSPAHGTIYATPHYLEGFVVFCLEHNLDGPGEGSGSNQSPSGPYVLVDMDTFVTDPDYGGTSGVRYKAKTMHALGWVLRHTYPFMVLDRTDEHNEEWSRAGGQFAMREVIKQLEGAKYVRSYWDMDNFYSFTGGAPAVYLTYARWLAENGIARASITGKITASNKSLIVSGDEYIGTVTLTTDADLIRIPKEAGPVTGNSAGSDKKYYYAKSGDTISVTSSESKFSISMESLSSSDEEANFLVGVPSVNIQKVLVPTYGAPNTLRTGSVSFKLSFGDILVTKKSADGILLKGTEFELLNSSGTVIATATTSDEGVATFEDLEPGDYVVREKTPSQGYSLAVTSSQNVSVVAGVNSNVTFTNNRIQGRIRVVKTDSITSKPLAGVVFTVTRLSGPESDHASDIGKIVATITTNAQGIAETGLLPWGEYRIDEVGVLDGYIDAGFTTTVWIR